MQISEMRAFRNLYSSKDLFNHSHLKFITNFNTPFFTSNKLGRFSRQFHSLNRTSRHLYSTNWTNNASIASINLRFYSSFGKSWVSNSVQDDEVASISGDENPRIWAVDENESGDEKIATLEGLGSFIEGALPERVVSADKKKKKKKPSGNGEKTPKSWLGSNSDDEVASCSGDEKRRVWTVGEDQRGDKKSVTLEGLGSFIEGSLPERVVNKSEEKPNGDEERTTKSWSRSNPKEGEKPRSKGGATSIVAELGPRTKKRRRHWVCTECGESFGQWWGSCRFCGGKVKEFLEADISGGFGSTGKMGGAWFHEKAGEMKPQRLTDVNKGVNQLTWRIPLPGLFGAEVARVLGGGLVPGSLVLVGGDPGVGKSTLLLQIAAMMAEGGDVGKPAPVLYVSGEESVEQIGNRADRMRIGTEDLFLYSNTDIEDILHKIQALSPRAVIIDSIQTVYLKGVTGSAGGLVQVKECTSALLRFAKKTNIPVILVGHVTKTGDLAGPRVLEHIVDVVLYMEGEMYSAHRFLRSVKNRFGSTDELGVFEMSQEGLQAVANPSDIFLSEQQCDSEVLAGLAVAVIIDGSRSFLLEIQALCSPDTSVTKQFTGVQQSRAEMIISVLVKQAGLMLQNSAIFVNVVSGVKLKETAGDLAIAVAICSSFLEFPIPNTVAFIGEVGLGGELRAVSRMEKRVNALAKLGYKKCIVPLSAEKPLATLNLDGLQILGCRNLKEVINIVFQS